MPSAVRVAAPSEIISVRDVYALEIVFISVLLLSGAAAAAGAV
jgi:hypothetical protein